MKKKFAVSLLFLFCLLFAMPAAASAYKNQWVKQGRDTYYYKADGTPCTNGPWKIKQKGVTNLYLFESDGRLIKSRITLRNGKYYLSYKDGRLLTDLRRIKLTDNKKYTFCGTKDGSLKMGLVKDKKGVFYFNKKAANPGQALTSGLTKIGKYYYYFTSSGKAYQNKIAKIGKAYYYFNQNGRRKGGVFKYGNYYYGFDTKTFKMVYGLKTINGKTYYFNKKKKGRAVTDSFLKINGKNYYFNSYGVLQTGWITVNARRYYMDPKKNGAQAFGTIKVDGTTYNLGTQGYLTYSPYNNVILRVNRKNCVITVYNGNMPFKAITCSVGLPTSPTPVGTFYIMYKARWHELNGPSYGQYCSKFLPSYLFHSVPMYGTTQDPYNVAANDYNNLGSPASGGCIRVSVADAKWIYDNVPVGATVVISDDQPMPLGKPATLKMPAGTKGKDPTDIWS